MTYKPTPRLQEEFEDFQRIMGISVEEFVKTKTAEGHSIPWIANKIGISAGTVRKLQKSLGVSSIYKARPSRFVALRDNPTIEESLLAIGAYTPKLHNRIKTRMYRNKQTWLEAYTELLAYDAKKKNKIETLRKAFEFWAEREHFSLDKQESPEIKYLSNTTEAAWAAWQGAISYSNSQKKDRD